MRNLDKINKQENLKGKLSTSNRSSNQGASTANRQQNFRRPVNKPQRKENTPGMNVVEVMDIIDSDSTENVTVNYIMMFIIDVKTC